MLTTIQLANLRYSLRARRVLSAYIDGSTRDPAAQRGWRVSLDRELRQLRRTLEDAPHDERAEFEDAVRHLEDEVAKFAVTVGAPGWVAFVTGDAVQNAGPLPVSVLTAATWTMGMHVAPYAAALKELRPIVIAVTDARTVNLYRYRMGELAHEEKIHIHRVGGEALHMGNAPQLGFHEGTRGRTARDAMQRTALARRDRMLAEAARKIAALASDDAWIVLGGIPRVVTKLEQALLPQTSQRVLPLKSLDVHSTEAEIAAAARASAVTLWEESGKVRLQALVERAEAAGLAVIGADATRKALDDACVGELLFTHHHLEQHADITEQAVRDALDQGAHVEEVTGAAASVLDAFGGIAAELRFRPEYLPRALGARPTEVAVTR